MKSSMAEISFHATTGWIFLTGLLILYAPQPSTFHEVDRRSTRESSDNIHYRDYVSAKTAQPRISRGRRQINSSSEEEDEDVSHVMWLSRHSSQSCASDPHGAGPSSRPDDECPVVTKRRRLDTPTKPADNTVIRTFLDSSKWPESKRKRFCKFVKTKVPDITRIQLTVLMRGFTGNATWNYEHRATFLNGFFRDPPEGWNQHACEEYLLVFFRTTYPGWSSKQQQYVIEHLLNPPPNGFDEEDRRYYLRGFVSEHPRCWHFAVHFVFREVYYRNMLQGEEQSYRALFDAFYNAPCWTYTLREKFVVGFLQRPPYGWDQRQRMEFLQCLARTSPMNQYLYFREGNYHFSHPQNVSSTLPPKEYRRPSYDSI